MDMDETLKEKEKVRRGTRGGTNEVGRTPNDHGKSHQTPNSIPSPFFLDLSPGLFISTRWFLRRAPTIPTTESRVFPACFVTKQITCPVDVEFLFTCI